MTKTFSTRGHYKNTARSRVSNLWDAKLCSSKYRRSILQKKIRYHKITVQLCPQQARKSLQMCSGIKSMSYTEKQTGPFCYIYIYIQNSKTFIYKHKPSPTKSNLQVQVGQADIIDTAKPRSKQQSSKRSISNYRKANPSHETSNIIVTKASLH